MSAGIVLLVAVHHDDDTSGGIVEPGADAGGLAEVPPELDDLDPGVDLVPGQRLGPRAVGAAVVDQDQLELEGEPVQDIEYLLDGGVDALLLVVEGDDDAEVHVRRG